MKTELWMNRLTRFPGDRKRSLGLTIWKTTLTADQGEDDRQDAGVAAPDPDRPGPHVLAHGLGDERRRDDVDRRRGQVGRGLGLDRERIVGLGRAGRRCRPSLRPPAWLPAGGRRRGSTHPWS